MKCPTVWFYFLECIYLFWEPNLALNPDIFTQYSCGMVSWNLVCWVWFDSIRWSESRHTIKDFIKVVDQTYVVLYQHNTRWLNIYYLYWLSSHYKSGRIMVLQTNSKHQKAEILMLQMILKSACPYSPSPL